MQTGVGSIGNSSALGEEASAHYIRSGGSFWLKLGESDHEERIVR